LKSRHIRIPYQDTTIPPERTKADIETLLKKAGAKGAQWRERYDLNETPTLEFIMDIEVKGVMRTLGFRMKPPALAQKKKGITSVNMSASLRLMWWYLKAKMEAVQFGLETFEKEFLSSVLTNLPDGRVDTIGEVATEMIANPSSKNILPSFDIRPPQLGDDSEV